MNDFYPLFVVSAVPSGDDIVFLHPRRRYTIKQHCHIVWEIISQSNGFQTSETIAHSVSKFVQNDVHELVHNIINSLRELGVVTDSREAFRFFHDLSTNPMPYSGTLNTEDLKVFVQKQHLSIPKGELIDLPRAAEVTPLTTLLHARKSTRNFSDEPVSMSKMSHILRSSYDLTTHSTPSGGSLYPLRIFVMILRSEGELRPGYYQFDSTNSQLVLLKSQIDFERLQFCFDSDSLVHNAPAIVTIGADLTRQSTKYSNRGYRYTLIEAGHAAQNMLLAAEEVGVASLEYGGFQDKVLADELGLTDEMDLPLISVALGYPGLGELNGVSTVLEKLKDDFVGEGKAIEAVGISMGNRYLEGEFFFGATATYKYESHSRNDPTQLKQRSRHTHGAATSTSLAQLKALVEALERLYSSRYRCDLLAKAENIQEPWVNPELFVPLTSAQYQAQSNLQPFSASKDWEWVKGLNLKNSQECYIPVDLVFYPILRSDVPRSLCYMAHSSGVAAHTSKPEAVKNALLELVERHAVMTNWFSRKPANQIPHEQLPYSLQRRVEFWEKSGRMVFVLDHSCLGMAVVNVIILSEDVYPCFVNGSSASISSFEEACSKALQEAEFRLVQTRKNSNIISPSVENIIGPADHGAYYYYPDHLDSIRWLWSGRVISEIPEISANLMTLMDTLEPICITLSPSDSYLKVVRVLSANLVPLNFGFGNEHYAHATLSGIVNENSLSVPHYFA